MISFKKLPIMQPIITSYQPHAQLFSIIENNLCAKYWIFNHFLQININKNINDRIGLDFYTGGSTGQLGHWKCCPYINYSGINRDFLKNNWKSLSDFLINCIDSNYYIMVPIDEFYISEYPAHQKYHVNHRILIFGYNKSNQTFNIADFFKDSKYYFSTATFDEIEKGFYEPEKSTYFFDSIDGVIMSKLCNYIGYNFNIELTIELLYDFLYSKDTSKRHRLIDIHPESSLKAYGLEVYNILEKYLLLLKEAKVNCDIKPFHVIYDHKNLMCLLVNNLIKQGYLKDSYLYLENYQKLLTDALTIRNIMLKYGLTGDNQIINKVLNKLKNISEEEHNIIYKLIKDINLTPKHIIKSNTKISSRDYTIEYSKAWGDNDLVIKKEFGTAAYTNNENSYAQWIFIGDEVRYYASMNKYCGKVDIYIDGNKETTIDLYSSETLYNQEIYFKSGLISGYHIIRISSSPNDQHEHSYISLDSFEGKLNTNNVLEYKNYVKFLTIDTETQGNWKTKYGTDGFDIISDQKSLPPYAYLKYPDDQIRLYVNGSNDTRALLKADSESERITAICTKPASITIDINICSNIDKKVSVYLLSWVKDVEVKLVNVELYDGDSGKLINIQTITLDDYMKGIYLCYSIRGRVKIIITNMSGRIAMFSGIFFG